jgi:hypothetical protein
MAQGKVRLNKNQKRRLKKKTAKANRENDSVQTLFNDTI